MRQSDCSIYWYAHAFRVNNGEAIGTLEREGIVKQAVKSLGFRELTMNRRRPYLISSLVKMSL